MSGNAILGAAEEAEKRWRAGDRPAVGEFRFVPPPTEPLDDVASAVTPNFAYTYGAQAVDLSVDIETGHLVVHEAVFAVDAGRAINPELVAGQIEGGVVQAHGYAVTEDLQVRDGRIVNPRLSTYLMPGILDIPERVVPVIVEEPDPRGPWGARGVAEVPLIAYAPAVVAAVHDATGVWFDALPLTPDRVVAGSPGRRGGRARLSPGPSSSPRNPCLACRSPPGRVVSPCALSWEHDHIRLRRPGAPALRRGPPGRTDRCAPPARCRGGAFA